ncbi:MAG TPA: ABC transporter permease [Candidatus Fraserbacteria bacterium]|nr:ABC transporter permease [Candidatus Fraserbacteria bacterium]
MLFILLTLVFLILRVMPGNPCLSMLGGRNVPQTVIVRCEQKYGLNKPLYVQYVEYLVNIARGNFGTSYRTGNPVLHDIFDRFPATFELAIFSMFFAILIGMSTGIFAATHSDRPADHSLRIFNIVSFAMPIFWVGLMAQLIFAVDLKVLPVGGRLEPITAAYFHSITGFYVLDSILEGNWGLLVQVLKHLLLPSLTLGLVQSGFLGRIGRASMLEVLDKDYVTTARSKGLRRKTVIYKHALKNALIPIVTITGLQFALLLSGAILTETTFSWPGLARYLLQSINARDFYALQGTIVFFGIFISTVNLVVDIIYSFIDPRVKY